MQNYSPPTESCPDVSRRGKLRNPFLASCLQPHSGQSKKSSEMSSRTHFPHSTPPHVKIRAAWSSERNSSKHTGQVRSLLLDICLLFPANTDLQLGLSAKNHIFCFVVAFIVQSKLPWRVFGHYTLRNFLELFTTASDNSGTSSFLDISAGCCAYTFAQCAVARIFTDNLICTFCCLPIG